MNYENLFLIHEDTYIDHINEKIQLYSMVKQLTNMVKTLPSNRGSAELTRLAATFDKKSDEMFKSWNIPASYLIFGDEDDLTGIMLDELLSPEAAGFVFCEGDCEECCRNEEACPCCAESNPDNENDNTDDEDNTPDVGELFTLLGEVMHSIFGDNVTVHVITE